MAKDLMQVSEELFALADSQQPHLAYYYSKPAPDRNSEEYMEYAAEITRLMSKADARISEVLNETILLRHIFIHPVRYRMAQTSPDGEILYGEALRTVLIDEDGMTYESVSEGQIQGIKLLYQLFGPPATWTRPIPVRVAQVPTRSGYRTFTLEVVRSGGEQASPKRSKR